MKTKKLIILVILFAFIILILAGCSYTEKRVEVPVRHEIEEAIEVKKLENKFVIIERVSLGGAGAGGLGAPMIFTVSAKQFIDLLPPGEPIYTAFQQDDDYMVKKVYWAFIENRAGLMVYEDQYTYQDSHQVSYRIERCTPEKIIFYYDNVDEVMLVIIFALIMLILLGMLIASSL